MPADVSLQALARWQHEGRRYSHRGYDIFYRIAGEVEAARVLVLIHGFPTASWDWHALWPQLCERFDCVVAPDMIGFGFSAKPPSYDYSIRDQADLHEGLLHELGVSRVHILAHDYGDTVAQELLARDAERRTKNDETLVLQSCVLLNGGLFPETHQARPIQKLLASPIGPLLARLTSKRQFARSFSAIFGPATRPTPAELDVFWKLVSRNGGNRIFHRLIRYMQERRENRERWVGVLHRTAVPLRVINGPEDPVSGAHMVARYREIVPNADVVELPGIGHYPQVEDPEGVLDAFFEFHATRIE